MEHLINPRVRQIRISGIRRFLNLVSRYPDAISFTIGQPDFPTPAHVKEAGKRAIDQNRTSYTPNGGILELREAACRFLKRKYGLDYRPEDEVIVTIGASQAIDIALRTILEEGCEVILPAPVYPGYEPIIRLCGAIPVHVDTRETRFILTADLIEKHLSPRTRCVILPYPSNPTGTVLNPGELEEIAALLRDREIFLLSDEIYSELVYDQPHASIAAFPGMREKTIVINGLSKSHSMTGWRIGFAFAPAWIIRQMLKVHQYNVSCASSVSQYAAVAAVTEGFDDAAPMREEYRRRRDYALERLERMGIEAVKPQGAFYIFPSIRKFNLSSLEFATRLLEEARVAVVPGDAFSVHGEGFVRISFACAFAQLEEGMNRLERFVQSL